MVNLQETCERKDENSEKEAKSSMTVKEKWKILKECESEKDYK